MDLRRLIPLARRWLPLLVVTVLLTGTAAYVVSGFQQKVYESKATLIVGNPLSAANPDYSKLLVAQGLAETYAVIAKYRPTLEAVIKDLGIVESPGALAGQVRVDAPVGTSLLIVTAADTDPARAAALANALAAQLIAIAPTIRGREADFQKSIEEDVAATQDLIVATQARLQALRERESRTTQQEAELVTLEGRLTSLRATYATLLSFITGDSPNQLSVVEPAYESTNPVSPKTMMNTLLAVALGVLVVLGVAYVTELLDDSIKDADTVQEVASLSTLGTIARMKGDRGRSDIYRLATLLYPRSGVAEAYRALRANVEFASVDVPMRTLLVTSSMPGEGKTVTASNLAVVFAQAGRRVLLVDADLRKPTVHRLFSLPNVHGLTTMLRSDAVAVDAVTHFTEQANLRVLTSGPLPPNPAELLGSHRMEEVLGLLQQHADLVIFDSPPLQAVADSAILSSQMSGTLLVIDVGRSRRRVVRAARETLARAGANVFGVVLNRVAAKSTGEYSGYYGDNLESAAGAAGRPLAPAGSADQPGPAATASRPG